MPPLASLAPSKKHKYETRLMKQAVTVKEATDALKNQADEKKKKSAMNKKKAVAGNEVAVVSLTSAEKNSDQEGNADALAEGDIYNKDNEEGEPKDKDEEGNEDAEEDNEEGG
jgi:hypothetical protein